MAKTKADNLFSLKITLRGIRPPIWRRLLVPGRMSLGDLHVAIQAAMGWEDAHLHRFDIAGRQYGDPDLVDDVANAEPLTLNGLVKSGVARFAYIYDFGDDWEHTVVIEGAQAPVEGRFYPTCIAGKRNCPPEDCGGPWGYQDLLDALADPTLPEHAERIEWIGKDYDPEQFSIPATNAIIAARFGRPRASDPQGE